MATETQQIVFPGQIEIQKLEGDLITLAVDGPVNELKFGDITFTGLFSHKKLSEEKWYVCANLDWAIKGARMEVPKMPPGYYLVTKLDASAS